MVGADYFADVKPNEKDWFMQYEWTYSQQSEFVEWLTEYLYNDKSARDEIMNWGRKNKKLCMKVAYEFVWNWGWKLKDGM